MSFVKYKNSNNASSLLIADITASQTAILITDWDQSLFPSSYPFLLTLEHLDASGNVILREIVKVVSWNQNSFTVERSAWICVQDDTATNRVQDNTAHAFYSWDKISLYWTAEQVADIQNNLEAKANQDSIANVYDNTATYAVWDIVVYNGDRYICQTAVATPEDFDSSKWTKVNIQYNLDDQEARIEALENAWSFEPMKVDVMIVWWWGWGWGWGTVSWERDWGWGWGAWELKIIEWLMILKKSIWVTIWNWWSWGTSSTYWNAWSNWWNSVFWVIVALWWWGWGWDCPTASVAKWRDWWNWGWGGFPWNTTSNLKTYSLIWLWNWLNWHNWSRSWHWNRFWMWWWGWGAWWAGWFYTWICISRWCQFMWFTWWKWVYTTFWWTNRYLWGWGWWGWWCYTRITNCYAEDSCYVYPWANPQAMWFNTGLCYWWGLPWLNSGNCPWWAGGSNTWWGWGWGFGSWASWWAWGSWLVIVRYPKDCSYWIKCATWWTITTSTINWVQYVVHTFTSWGTFQITQTA